MMYPQNNENKDGIKIHCEKRMKDNPEEVSKMCKLVENYAKEYAKERMLEGNMKGIVETSIECGRSKEETIAKLEKKFELSEKDPLPRNFP